MLPFNIIGHYRKRPAQEICSNVEPLSRSRFAVNINISELPLHLCRLDAKHLIKLPETDEKRRHFLSDILPLILKTWRVYGETPTSPSRGLFALKNALEKNSANRLKETRI